MILLRLNGGLGNQMFQYAFSRFLAEKYHQKICIDFSEFKNANRNYNLDMFPLSADLIVELESLKSLETYRVLHLKEESFRFNNAALNSFDDFDLDNSLFFISGYWQSPFYFERIESIIRGDFEKTYKIDTSYLEILELALTTESIMVHVRRGDYLWPGNLDKHGIVPVEYILKGISYFRSKLKNPRFLVFSDDPIWCRNNIDSEIDITFVNQDHDEGKSSFTLMRQCKHFLISNSTYSWWAAWLGENPGKEIICPKKWFNINNSDSLDLIPSTWKRF